MLPRRNPVACQILPVATRREAETTAADEVIVAASLAGFADPVRRAPTSKRKRRQANPYISDQSQEIPSALLPKGKSKKWAADGPDEALTLYAGHEGLLVRTALIRPPGYRAADRPKISDPYDVVRLVAHLKHSDQEHFVVISVDATQTVLAIYEVAIGTRSSAQMDLRDVVKTVVLSGGVGAIVVHNHPSGNPKPSQHDLDTTVQVKAAMNCIGIQLQDHVIIAHEGHTSFFSKGLLLCFTTLCEQTPPAPSPAPSTTWQTRSLHTSPRASSSSAQRSSTTPTKLSWRGSFKTRTCSPTRSSRPRARRSKRSSLSLSPTRSFRRRLVLRRKS